MADGAAVTAAGHTAPPSVQTPPAVTLRPASDSDVTREALAAAVAAAAPVRPSKLVLPGSSSSSRNRGHHRSQSAAATATGARTAGARAGASNGGQAPRLLATTIVNPTSERGTPLPRLWLRDAEADAKRSRLKKARKRRSTAAKSRKQMPLYKAKLPCLPYKMSFFSIFASQTTMFLVGHDAGYHRFRVIKFDRRPPRPPTLTTVDGAERDDADARREHLKAMQGFVLRDVCAEYPKRFTLQGVNQLLASVHTAANGGLQLVTHAIAVLGTIRFLSGYYLVVATERTRLGSIGSHRVFGVGHTELVPITQAPVGAKTKNPWGAWVASRLFREHQQVAEEKYRTIFQAMDMTKDCFFSYSLDLTTPMQELVTHEPADPDLAAAAGAGTDGDATPGAGAGAGAGAGGGPHSRRRSHSRSRSRSRSASTPRPHAPGNLGCKYDRFAWNKFLSEELLGCVSSTWVVTLLHGYFKQSPCQMFGRGVSLTLMARRSRHFAGTRYLKRGANADGKVANDVEVEQILDDYRGRFASYRQVRGSVPVFWAQETRIAQPKPPITLSPDPSYQAAQHHFADLFQRYGAPVLVLNLVKKRERRARELLIGNEFADAVTLLNKFLPQDKRIQYFPFDFSALSKSKHHNVVACLQDVATWASGNTSFYCNAPLPASRLPPVVQKDFADAVARHQATEQPRKNSRTTGTHEAVQRPKRLPNTYIEWLSWCGSHVFLGGHRWTEPPGNPPPRLGALRPPRASDVSAASLPSDVSRRGRGGTGSSSVELPMRLANTVGAGAGAGSGAGAAAGNGAAANALSSGMTGVTASSASTTADMTDPERRPIASRAPDAQFGAGHATWSSGFKAATRPTIHAPLGDIDAPAVDSPVSTSSTRVAAAVTPGAQRLSVHGKRHRPLPIDTRRRYIGSRGFVLPGYSGSVRSEADSDTASEVSGLDGTPRAHSDATSPSSTVSSRAMLAAALVGRSTTAATPRPSAGAGNITTRVPLRPDAVLKARRAGGGSHSRYAAVGSLVEAQQAAATSNYVVYTGSSLSAAAAEPLETEGGDGDIAVPVARRVHSPQQHQQHQHRAQTQRTQHHGEDGVIGATLSPAAPRVAEDTARFLSRERREQATSLMQALRGRYDRDMEALAARVHDMLAVGGRASYAYVNLPGRERECGDDESGDEGAADGAADGAAEALRDKYRDVEVASASTGLQVPRVFTHEAGQCLQRGVVRTNCVDCLDRTNVAQFFIGVNVLGRQLHALGFVAYPTLPPKCGAVVALMELYEGMGDRLAMQYGGSEAHKKVHTQTPEVAAKKHRRKSTSKELVTSIKRYYSNTFADKLRQDAMNLFLGLYQPLRDSVRGKCQLWELETDRALHDPALTRDPSARALAQTTKVHLDNWWEQPLSAFEAQCPKPAPTPPQSRPTASTPTASVAAPPASRVAVALPRHARLVAPASEAVSLTQASPRGSGSDSDSEAETLHVKAGDGMGEVTLNKFSDSESDGEGGSDGSQTSREAKVAALAHVIAGRPSSAWSNRGVVTSVFGSGAPIGLQLINPQRPDVGVGDGVEPVLKHADDKHLAQHSNFVMGGVAADEAIYRKHALTSFDALLASPSTTDRALAVASRTAGQVVRMRAPGATQHGHVYTYSQPGHARRFGGSAPMELASIRELSHGSGVGGRVDNRKGGRGDGDAGQDGAHKLRYQAQSGHQHRHRHQHNQHEQQQHHQHQHKHQNMHQHHRRAASHSAGVNDVPRRRSGVRPLAYAFSMAREMLSSMTRRPKQHAAPQREQSVHEAEHARQHGSPLAAKYAKAIDMDTYDERVLKVAPDQMQLFQQYLAEMTAPSDDPAAIREWQRRNGCVTAVPHGRLAGVLRSELASELLPKNLTSVEAGVFTEYVNEDPLQSIPSTGVSARLTAATAGFDPIIGQVGLCHNFTASS